MGVFKWRRSQSFGSNEGAAIHRELPSRSSSVSGCSWDDEKPEWDEYSLSPTSSVQESVALSESNTLLQQRHHRHELQATYENNYTMYYPFLLHRMRLEALRNSRRMSCIDDDGDDASTIFNESSAPHGEIMQKPLSHFDTKREVIIGGEFMKSVQYVFPCRESFELFKSLKKRKRKESFSYTEDDEIRIAGKGEQIDNRSHLIPLDYKIKGVGLPIFKVTVPYLSSFKKNTPFILFKRYREKPPRPSADSTKDDSYETYTYCTVYTKHFQKVRRATFRFTIESSEGMKEFSLYLFMHAHKPFADFIYQGTRFRVLGTPTITTIGINYNPSLKLLIVDDGKPSLCDQLVNKKNFELSKILKKEAEQEPVQFDINEPSTHINPYPDPENPLLQDGGFFSGTPTSAQYICDTMPPFGTFKDSMLDERNHSSIIPKKYSELGKIELYQDRVQGNPESTLSFDQDTLVLLCVLTTLREISVKNAGNAKNTATYNRITAAKGVTSIAGSGLFL